MEPAAYFALIDKLARYLFDEDLELTHAQITAVVGEGARNWSERQRNEFATLVLYTLASHRWDWSGAQPRARKLLRSYLTRDQRRSVAAHGRALVRGSAGGHYWLYPFSGTVEKVERRRVRWRATGWYCIHPPQETVPPADVSLGHLLLLTMDEEAFLAEANYRPAGNRR